MRLFPKLFRDLIVPQEQSTERVAEKENNKTTIERRIHVSYLSGSVTRFVFKDSSGIFSISELENTDSKGNGKPLFGGFSSVNLL